MSTITPRAHIAARSTAFSHNWFKLPNGEPPRVLLIDGEEPICGYISIWSPPRAELSANPIVFVEVCIQTPDEDKVYVKLYEGAPSEEIVDLAIRDFNRLADEATGFPMHDVGVVSRRALRLGFFRVKLTTMSEMRHMYC